MEKEPSTSVEGPCGVVSASSAGLASAGLASKFPLAALALHVVVHVPFRCCGAVRGALAGLPFLRLKRLTHALLDFFVIRHRHSVPLVASVVEVPGIEPGSVQASSVLLRV